MLSWIGQLCVLCSMSTLAQMMLPKESGREGIRVLCGMMMLKLTCECASNMLRQLTACTDLEQLFSCLIQ